MTAPLRALIVDDCEEDALMLTRFLNKAGYRVTWEIVQTREEIERAVADRKWDIVFCDYGMPHLNGTEALSCVRRHDIRLPFVFVSGTIEAQTAAAALQTEAQDYIRKDDLTRLPAVVARELAAARTDEARGQQGIDWRNLARVVQQSADSILVTDTRGTIQYVNAAFERMSGYTAAEIIGRTPAVLRSNVHDPDYFATLWQSLSAGETFSGTFVNRHKNGSLFYEEKTIVPLTDTTDRIIAYVSTGRSTFGDHPVTESGAVVHAPSRETYAEARSDHGPDRAIESPLLALLAAALLLLLMILGGLASILWILSAP